MRESDYHTCADMMRKRWACDEVKDNPELAINYGYMFLHYSLATASAAFVADEDGKAIGLLILEIKDGHPMKIQHFLQMLERVAALCTDPNAYDNVMEWIALEKEYRTRRHCHIKHLSSKSLVAGGPRVTTPRVVHPPVAPH